MRSGFLWNIQKLCLLSLSQTGWRCLQQHGLFMPSFRPPPNSLDYYQLELCADAFRRTWLAIVPTGRHLPNAEQTCLENEVSERLCFFASKGVVDPQTLQGLTVATVKLHRRANPPLRGKQLKRHSDRSSEALKPSASAQPLRELPINENE